MDDGSKQAWKREEAVQTVEDTKEKHQVASTQAGGVSFWQRQWGAVAGSRSAGREKKPAGGPDGAPEWLQRQKQWGGWPVSGFLLAFYYANLDRLLLSDSDRLRVRCRLGQQD